MSARVQLEVYAFGSDASFEGWLVNALERLEAAGSARVVDALFVTTDRASGEAAVFDARGEGLTTMLVPLIDFRLDAGARKRATAEAMTVRAVRELVAALEPGSGLAAVLLEPLDDAAVESPTLADAVSRARGTPVVSKRVEARRLSEVATELRSVVR